MAEYLIQGETLTEIANAVRTLNGTEGAMAPSEMKSGLESFSSDMSTVVSEQDSLIEQITTALGGKVAPSGPEIETCTVTLISDSTIVGDTSIYYMDENLTAQYAHPDLNTFIKPIKGSFIFIEYIPNKLEITGTVGQEYADNCFEVIGDLTLHFK